MPAPGHSTGLGAGSSAARTQGALAAVQTWARTADALRLLGPAPPRPAQVTAGNKLHLGADATLVVDAADVQIKSLDLRRGTLLIRGGAVVDGVEVENAGWEWAPLDPDAAAAEEEYIRGFRVLRHEQQELP